VVISIFLVLDSVTAADLCALKGRHDTLTAEDVGFASADAGASSEDTYNTVVLR
jgi:hypothetical protein